MPDTGEVTSQDRRAYRERVAAGGCRNGTCAEPGRPEFAVWWKCPAGHRRECLYCAAHGPEHLAVAVRGALIMCECGEWAAPLVEGLPTAAERNADPEMMIMAKMIMKAREPGD